MLVEDLTVRQGGLRFDVYTAQASTATTDSISTWKKPNGCKYIYMFIVGSGGGGGRPVNDASIRGGGGGGSGNTATLLIPACFIPDILYLKPGKGGAGASTAGTSGTAGSTTYVSALPTITTNPIFSMAGGNGGSLNSTGGGGGNSPTKGFWSVGAVFPLFNTGINGSAGASATNGSGTNLIPNNSIISSGGSGGGNGTGSGGNITSGNGMFTTLIGGTGTTGGNGINGLSMNDDLGQSLLSNYNRELILVSGGSDITSGKIWISYKYV